MTRDEAEQAIRDYQAWVEKPANHIEPLVPAAYCGSITFKVHRGNITGVNVELTSKPKEKEERA